jgi:hypothetical protein
MSPFEPLQPDTRQQRQQRTMCTAAIADTRMIALIASKKNFNPDKERLLIEKARMTKCRCRHFTNTEPCLYRNCRHFAETHYNNNNKGNDSPKAKALCHMGKSVETTNTKSSGAGGVDDVETTTTTKKESFIGNMTTGADIIAAVTPEEEEQMDQDEFEFQIALMREEEREFNRTKMRETGYRIGFAI